MITLAGVIHATPEGIEQMADAIKTMVAASNAEPGCHAYSFAQDVSNPSDIRVFECWESDEALAEHFTMPHMAAFQAAMAEVTVTGMEIQKFEISSVAPFAPGD